MRCSDKALCCTHDREPSCRAHHVRTEFRHKIAVIESKAATPVGCEARGIARLAGAIGPNLTEESPFAQAPCSRRAVDSAPHQVRQPEKTLHWVRRHTGTVATEGSLCDNARRDSAVSKGNTDRRIPIDPVLVDVRRRHLDTTQASRVHATTKRGSSPTGGLAARSRGHRCTSAPVVTTSPGPRPRPRRDGWGDG